MSTDKEAYFDFFFGNDASLGPDQYFDIEEGSESEETELYLYSNPILTLDVLHSAFTDFSTLLSKYNCFQLANGLDYIFNPCFSNLGFVLKNEALDLQKRVVTVEALADFMLHIFEDNAELALSNASMTTTNKANSALNDICYMFWDTAHVFYECEDKEDKIAHACVDVMGKCAQSKNMAVVVGALHGLGHAQLYLDGPKLQSYIDNARIEKGPFFEAMTAYADRARKGNVL